MKKMIKFLIFDIDGTLYKRRSVVQEYLKQFARHENLKFSKLHAAFTESYIKANKKSYRNTEAFWSSVHDIFLKEINSSKRDLLDKLVENAKKSALYNIKPREGLLTLLQKVKNAGIKIILFTGSNSMYKSIKLDDSDEEYKQVLSFKEKQLKRLGISKYIDKLILTHKYGGFKPQKFVFQGLLKDLNAEPGECIMIGDQYNDIGATQIGIFSILIGNNSCKKFKPNLRINSFQELIDIIDFGLCSLKPQH